MAEVYKARAVEGPRKNQLVALKRLTPRLASDPEAVDLFCGEADVSAMLKHPNIVEVFEAGVVGEVYYLAMEYVDGRDLALILARCRERRIFLPVHFAVHIAKATLDALAYAHAARGPTGLHLNIVHCDVSPSNLFISRLGEIKLGDFGIAKVRSLGDGDQAGTLWGKLAYLAPEQLERRPLSRQVDLWGAATILYEALTNRRAIEGSSNDQLLGVAAPEREPDRSARQLRRVAHREQDGGRLQGTGAAGAPGADGDPFQVQGGEQRLSVAALEGDVERVAHPRRLHAGDPRP